MWCLCTQCKLYSCKVYKCYHAGFLLRNILLFWTTLALILWSCLSVYPTEPSDTIYICLLSSSLVTVGLFYLLKPSLDLADQCGKNKNIYMLTFSFFFFFYFSFPGTHWVPLSAPLQEGARPWADQRRLDQRRGCDGQHNLRAHH